MIINNLRNNVKNIDCYVGNFSNVQYSCMNVELGIVSINIQPSALNIRSVPSAVVNIFVIYTAKKTEKLYECN